MSDKDPAIKWMEFYRDEANRGGVPIWPNESLVRLLKAKYFPWFKENYEGLKVLDVGFGGGNNLTLCGTLGMELYGVEVHEDICLQTADNLA